MTKRTAPVSKRELLVNALNAQDFKTALRIANKFFTGMSKDQLETVQIAHECENGGRAAFYQSLKIDTAAKVAEAREILLTIYLKPEAV